MPRYRKSDVTFHDGHPAVNVKVPYLSYSEWDNLAWQVAGDEDVIPEHFIDAMNEWREENDTDWIWETACESGWDQLQYDVGEIWPIRQYGKLQVYAEGRSDGWAVVDGLDDFESWDAIELARWAKFAKWARIIADGVPYEMLTLFLLNVYEPPDPLVEAVWRAQ